MWIRQSEPRPVSQSPKLQAWRLGPGSLPIRATREDRLTGWEESEVYTVLVEWPKETANSLRVVILAKVTQRNVIFVVFVLKDVNNKFSSKYTDMTMV